MFKACAKNKVTKFARNLAFKIKSFMEVIKFYGWN